MKKILFLMVMSVAVAAHAHNLLLRVKWIECLVRLANPEGPDPLM